MKRKGTWRPPRWSSVSAAEAALDLHSAAVKQLAVGQHQRRRVSKARQLGERLAGYVAASLVLGPSRADGKTFKRAIALFESEG